MTKLLLLSLLFLGAIFLVVAEEQKDKLVEKLVERDGTKPDGAAKEIKADEAAKDQDEDLEEIEDGISRDDMEEDEDEAEDEIKRQEKSDPQNWRWVSRRRRNGKRWTK